LNLYLLPFVLDIHRPEGECLPFTIREEKVTNFVNKKIIIRYFCSTKLSEEIVINLSFEKIWRQLSQKLRKYLKDLKLSDFGGCWSGLPSSCCVVMIIVKMMIGFVLQW